LAVIPVLRGLLNYKDFGVVEEACSAFASLSSNALADDVVKDGVKTVVDLLLHASIDVQRGALKAVNNMLSASEPQAQFVLNCGAMASVGKLLKSSKKGVKKQACLTISNFAGNPVG
jgi:hypothetical protein